jgi:hypothetical protein
MLFQLPPALPPTVFAGLVWGLPNQGFSNNCQKGSRDCFPIDRVGGAIATPVATPVSQALSLAELSDCSC